MPVVLRINGFRILVLNPPREHGPPHVHVEKAGSEIVVTLAQLSVRKDDGMRPSDVIAAVRIVEAHHDLLMREWRKRHG